jgi:hypothetical protein
MEILNLDHGLGDQGVTSPTAIDLSVREELPNLVTRHAEPALLDVADPLVAGSDTGRCWRSSVLCMAASGVPVALREPPRRRRWSPGCPSRKW